MRYALNERRSVRKKACEPLLAAASGEYGRTRSSLAAHRPCPASALIARRQEQGLYESQRCVSYDGKFSNGLLEGLKASDCPSTPGPLVC